MFKQILMVCVGNICRSPMAEALLDRALNDSGCKHIKVSSAGLQALVGESADPVAEQLMRERGIDISPHRARQLTPPHIYAADLILVMEKIQKKSIELREPSATGKVYRLGQWSDFDVPDPYKQTDAAFRAALELILKGVSDWTVKIRERQC